MKLKNRAMLPKKFSLLLIFSIILTLGLSISLGSLLAAWTSPTAIPPGNNIASPINTSATGQSKQGGLILNTGGSTNGLIVQFGNVGIGTIDPQAKLEVNGNIIAADPTANNQVATKGYVDNTVSAAGSGPQYGCYWDYSNTCITNYIPAKSSTYGYCYFATQQSYLHRPPGGTCTGASSSGDLGTAALCCPGSLKSNGETCTLGGECTSGNCADGYCCNSACGGSCDKCDVAGSVGTCTSVASLCSTCTQCVSGNCTNVSADTKAANCNGDGQFCSGYGSCQYCRWVKYQDCGVNYGLSGYVTMTCSQIYSGATAGYFSRYGSEGTWTSLYGNCVAGYGYNDAARYNCTCTGI